MIEIAFNIALIALCIIIIAMAVGAVALVVWGIVEFIKFQKEE